MSAYHPNDREKVRRAYLQRGPCQPTQHEFPKTLIGNKYRRFCSSWFNEFGKWLEYSIEKDAAFGFCCYLFRPEQVRDIYRTRLTASVDCVSYLLKQGLVFRGYDESTDSANQGNFLELLKFLSEHSEMVNKVVLENAPENHKLTAPTIQKDIAHAAALETNIAIVDDIGDELFAILVDESRDISNKEQTVVALRYVNKNGSIVERFLGIVHVKDTLSLSLKMAIGELFYKHGLSISSIRGQGYDGASNMQGEFNGLKSLILRENSSAFYVHCFAHQLQLTLVVVAQEHIQVVSLFNFVSTLLNVVRGSCKRLDMLREKQIKNVKETIENGGIPSGQGLNQETSLKRATDTRWSSHYGSLVNLIRQQICVACLDPRNLFSAFDKAKLVEFARFYPRDFSHFDLVKLDNQLQNYFIDMRSDVEFSHLKGIGNPSEKLVETRKHVVYPLVYNLLKLAMILLVSTVTVEREFSAMKIVKTRLRNRMRDAWMNDCLVTYMKEMYSITLTKSSLSNDFKT